MTAPRTRRRSKLAPDPNVHRAIVTAAAQTLREQGVRGVSVAALLDRAKLSTRAFYRHFDSKDQVVAAVFLDMAHAERRRLQRKMAKATDPVEAVVAWIDGRLDLAFDENIKSECAACRWKRSRRCSPRQNWSSPRSRRCSSR